MNDKRFDEIPMVLETIDDTIWAEEVKNPPAEQVALEPTPIRGLTFVHS